MRRAAVVCATLLAGACSGSTPVSESSLTTETETRRSATIVSEPPANTSVAPTPSSAVDAVAPGTATRSAPTTTVLTFPSLVPPADPSSMIGNIISTRQILSNPGSVPESSLRVPSLLINGAESNLASYGGACVTPDCQHAVELLADSQTFINDGWPTAS